MRTDEAFEAELAALPGETNTGKIKRAVHLLWYLLCDVKVKGVRFTAADGTEAFLKLERPDARIPVTEG